MLPARPAARTSDGRRDVHALCLQEHECLGHQRDVACHDELVRGLDGLPGAGRADVQDRGAHRIQQGPGRLDVGGRPADHDRQCPVDGAPLAAAHRRVEAAQPVRRAGARHPAGDLRPDRAHVDVERAGGRAAHYAVWPQRDGLDVRGIREHGDDRVGVPHGGGHAAGPPATRGDQLLRRIPAGGSNQRRQNPP